jgi:hypothetical protein
VSQAGWLAGWLARQQQQQHVAAPQHTPGADVLTQAHTWPPAALSACPTLSSPTTRAALHPTPSLHTLHCTALHRRDYAAVDARLRPLVLLVKFW